MVQVIVLELLCVFVSLWWGFRFSGFSIGVLLFIGQQALQGLFSAGEEQYRGEQDGVACFVLGRRAFQGGEFQGKASGWRWRRPFSPSRVAGRISISCSQ